MSVVNSHRVVVINAAARIVTGSFVGSIMCMNLSEAIIVNDQLVTRTDTLWKRRRKRHFAMICTWNKGNVEHIKLPKSQSLMKVVNEVIGKLVTHRIMSDAIKLSRNILRALCKLVVKTPSHRLLKAQKYPCQEEIPIRQTNEENRDTLINQLFRRSLALKDFFMKISIGSVKQVYYTRLSAAWIALSTLRVSFLCKSRIFDNSTQQRSIPSHL